jgi:hypothetical protein
MTYLAQGNSENIESLVFQVVETGIGKNLMRLFLSTGSLKLSKVFAYLCMGNKREVQKLLNSGLLKILMESLAHSTNPKLSSNILWALTNICQACIEFRDKIAVSTPLIFEILINLFEFYQFDFLLHFEIIYFTSSMLNYGNFQTEEFYQTYTLGIDLLCQGLKTFEFKDELDKRETHYLFNIVSSLL